MGSKRLNKIDSLEMISLLVTVCFVLIPGMIYLPNRADFQHAYSMFFLVAIFGIPVFALLGLIFLFLAIFWGNGAKYFSYLIFWLGATICLNDIFAPVQLGLLDGSNMASPQFVIYNRLELLIAVVMAISTWYAARKSLRWPIFFARSGLVMSFLLLLLVGLVDKEDEPNQLKALSTNDKNPNIYHIHLDAEQSDFLLRLIRDRGLAKQFAGFSFFQQNTSSYPYTIPSMANYLTSTTHKPGKFDSWLKMSDRTLLKSIKDRGYNLHHYGESLNLHAKIFDRATTATELISQKQHTEFPFLVQYIQIWMARISPNFMTNKALVVGQSIGEYAVQTLFKVRVGDVPTTIAEGLQPYGGALLLKKLIRDESYRPSTNQMVYATPVIPHSPWILRTDCSYQKSDLINLKKEIREYFNQNTCAIDLVLEFLATLKRMGRYDSSIIVIHGDHGEGWLGQLRNEDTMASTLEFADLVPFDRSIHAWSLAHLEGRARAALMIKPVGKMGSMVISDFPSQLADIYPTIMGMLGTKISGAAIEGVDLFKTTEEMKLRERFLFYGDTWFKGVTYRIRIVFDKNGLLSLLPLKNSPDSIKK